MAHGDITNWGVAYQARGLDLEVADFSGMIQNVQTRNASFLILGQVSLLLN